MEHGLGISPPSFLALLRDLSGPWPQSRTSFSPLLPAPVGFYQSSFWKFRCVCIWASAPPAWWRGVLSHFKMYLEGITVHLPPFLRETQSPFNPTKVSIINPGETCALQQVNPHSFQCWKCFVSVILYTGTAPVKSSFYCLWEICQTLSHLQH